MKLSHVIKCRITPATRREVEAAAERAGATASDVMRVAIDQVVESRSLDAKIRNDMLTVRLIANNVLTWAENAGLGPDESRGLVEAGERLREVAARHLKPLS